MNATVQLRNLVIGEGAPKICVPVLGTTQESIREAVEALKGHPFDMVEWRADYFEHIRQPKEVEAVLGMLREIFCRKSRFCSRSAPEKRVGTRVSRQMII